MKVSELGEFGLIDLLAQVAYSAKDEQIASWKQLIIGIGDDAAAWQSNASIQLATVDSLIENIHFSLTTTSWRELGWKALAVNISDIAAMGGIPRYALVSLALPGHTEVNDVIALYQGMVELAQEFEVAIIGGNTSSAPTVTISITVIGCTGNHDKILTRSSAKSGEKIAVTGHLGTAAAGLEMLNKKLKFDKETTASLNEAFLRPYPRTTEGQLLVEQGVRAAIDISDGLISDLQHLCKASHVGARIEVDRVPVLPAVKDNFREKSLELALAGGEDYELLFTASTSIIDRIKTKTTCPITVIGDIVTDDIFKITMVNSQGIPFNLSRTGWEHFIT